MIAEASIEQVKAAANVIEVIGTFVNLKKEGTNYVACCPFHSERTPSFKVSASKQIYKCFGCGVSGDVISFLVEYNKMGYVQAIEWLAKKYNIQLQQTEMNTKKLFEKPLPRLQKVGDKTMSFFESRGISNNTLLRHNITESKEWMPQFKEDVTCICFNYYRGEELVNIKFRGPNKSFKLSKDAELVFYNLNAIETGKTVTIVEGEIDCLSMYEAGIHDCISVPNGAGTGNLKLEYMDNCWKYFENKERIVIAVDNDEPGSKLKEELARRLGKERVWVMSYPEGCKDANDILVKHGKEELRQLWEGAREWPLEGIVAMDDMFEELSNYYLHGYPEGAKAGIFGFDDHLSFMPGQLTVITGIPGSGKDEFANWIMTGLARNHDWPFAICGMEEPPAFHATKLIEKFQGKAFGFRQNPEHRISHYDFERGVQLVDKYFHFINVSKVEVTMDSILKQAEILVKRKGIKALMINPWNCLEHKIPDGYSETQYVSEVLTVLINFLGKYGLHGFLVAHPTKIQKNKQTGKYEVPTLYSISGSAHFFNKTHNGISIWRDFETGLVDVHIQKVKWSWLGKIGCCSFNFNTMTRQYTIA